MPKIDRIRSLVFELYLLIKDPELSDLRVRSLKGRARKKIVDKPIHMVKLTVIEGGKPSGDTGD